MFIVIFLPYWHYSEQPCIDGGGNRCPIGTHTSNFKSLLTSSLAGFEPRQWTNLKQTKIVQNRRRKLFGRLEVFSLVLVWGSRPGDDKRRTRFSETRQIKPSHTPRPTDASNLQTNFASSFFPRVGIFAGRVFDVTDHHYFLMGFITEGSYLIK